MQNQMADGTHDGTAKGATMYEAESGAMMACFDVEIDGGGPIMRGWITLAQKDGTLNERGFADVRSILGWQDWDWQAWNQPPEHFAGHRVSVVLETKPDEQSGQPRQRIRYVNPPTAGLKRGDAKVIAAKYGPRLRALTGGSPSSSRPAGTTAALAPRPVPARPAVPLQPLPPAQSSMDACWLVFCQRTPGKSEAEIPPAWFAFIGGLYAGRDPVDLTPAEWGAVMVAMNDDLPF